MPTTVKTIGDVKADTGHGKFVEETLVNAPDTAIINRAKVSTSLKPIMGNERIHCNSLRLIPDEFGPNGEPVYTSDKEDSRVRFYGRDWNSVYTTYGTRPQISAPTEYNYCEVTFYGTGLNLLTILSVGFSFEVSIDGGPYSSIAQAYSDALGNRNYSENSVLNLYSNRSQGWHTVSLRNNVNNANVFGFEILNENSQIVVPAGTCFSEGEKIEVSSAVLDYNAGFENETSIGQKGGRAVIAVDKEDGVVKKWFTKVNSAPAYLASADHSNEAIYRRINFREFGRNRSVDDFSTLAGVTSDRAFTLDDGTTTLVANDVQALTNQGLDTLCTATTNDSFTVTFVGTGLDVYGAASADSADEWTVSVDGVSVGTTFFQGRAETLKICSGLPYGTHTVKFVKTVHSVNGGVHDFIVYQPKKPTLPAGAVELGEYNLMADYNNVNNYGESLVSQGVLRKQNMREFVYEKSWSITVQPAANSGFQAVAPLANSKMKYTFFGTGCELRYQGQSDNSPNMQVYLNGVAANDTNYPTLSASINQAAGGSYNLSTGIADIRDTTGCVNGGLVLTGLPLGEYTIQFDVQSDVGGQDLNFYSLDIITPINAPHTTFGSMSIRDLRKFEADNTVNKIIKNHENNLLVNTVEQEIINSEGISQVLRGGNGIFWVYYEEPYIDEEFYVFGTSDSDNSVSAGLPSISDGQSRTPSSVRVYNRNLAGTPEDERRVNITTKHILQKDKFKE